MENLLKAIEAQIEQNLDQKYREAYEKIVVSGMSIAMEGGPNSIIAGVKDSKDPINDAAKGAVNLILMMRKQAKGVMPVQAMVPAAMTLMLRALAIVERAKIAKVDKAALDQATRTFMNKMMEAIGVNGKQLKHAAGKINDMVNDPQALQKMKMAAGVVQHPNAAKPTPLPAATEV